MRTQKISSGSLRPMRVEDIEMVYEIECLCFQTPWAQDSFRQELENNHVARYLVYEVQGQVVAYAGIWLILSEGHITNVAVHPEYQGRGVGRLITEAILRLARCYDVEDVTLEVRPTNTVALRLYHALGFVVCGTRKGYYTDTHEDALVMWKRGLGNFAIDEEECCHVFGV